MTCCGGRRRRSPGGDPHGWNSLDHYLAIHARRLADFTHFIVADDLQIEVIGDSLFIRGRLTCEHGLFIDVVKALDINDRGQVRTRQYAYHAGVIGDADRSIFRYDNHDQKLGHPDRHHCHRFDYQTWTEILPPVEIGRAHV